jgi:hypothetical protein
VKRWSKSRSHQAFKCCSSTLTSSQDGDRSRPVDTVKPLSKALGIKIDSKVQRNDVKGAAKAAEAYKGPGNVLICWEHGELAKIANALGVTGYAAGTGWTGSVKYPDDRFDLIWTLKAPYNTIDSVTSEGVDGLDAEKTGQPVVPS